jgi:threonine dehydrogenase-like Zn-dependent dehydrogenase
MRELTFTGEDRVEWRQAEAPALEGDGEAIVRPLAVATCDLDTAVIAGRVPIPPPFPLGHECVAEVVEVGGSVTGVAPGDRVSVAFQISCGECGPCRAGHTGSCTETPRLAMYGLPLGENWGGFLSDAVRVPYADAMLVQVPDGVEAEAAASVSDNIVDAWRTVGPQLAERPGASVLICGGAGSIDQYSVAIAAALGAGAVDYLPGRAGPRREQAGELAARLGARVIDEEEIPDRLGPYPITVDASADPAALACALRSTEPDGVCTSIGIYYEPTTPVPLLEMYTKGITFHTGRVHARPAMPEVLELISSGRLDPVPVTRRRLAWEEAEALPEERVKTVISRA